MSTPGSLQGRLLAIAGVASMIIAAACSGGSAKTTPAAAAPKAAASTALSAAAPGAGVAASDELARGREIFTKTAGGVGCAFCHGADGKGNGPSGVGAPPNRGLDEERVRTALKNVEMMRIVKLNDDEIKAVVAYLAYLGKQP